MTSEYEAEEILKIRSAAAEDLKFLALLHSEELTHETAGELHKYSFQERLALVIESKLGDEALLVLNEGLATLDGGDKVLDDLAADYADIYVTHRLQLSPCESPWLDEDRLVNGEPMFKVRSWYQKFGLEAENWRLRADDHMSLQMIFIAHLLERDDVELETVGQFMDEHILRWLDQFAELVSQRCATPFYAGLAMYTFVYMDELRTLIEQVTGVERARPNEEEEGANSDDMAPFAPGAEPGW